jgi:nucleoside 2-deoxyribosyltransferase
MTKHRIYCAGPLFNPSERAEMEMLAEVLELSGFNTFLPHRDAFVFGVVVPDIVRAGYPLEAAQWMAHQAIFAVDICQVLVDCEGLVVNLNGRVPDEGAVVEGAIAWTVGKAVVLFKDDSRSKIDGLDNPLVAGLGGFRSVHRSEDLPPAMTHALREHPPEALRVESLPVTTRQAIERGRRLIEVYAAEGPRRLIQVIVEIFDEFRGVGQEQRRLRR